MYKLTFDGWPLYDPRGANKIDRLIIREPDVQIGVNNAGSIKFALDPGHPYADKITKLCGTLELADDAGVLFRGRVLDDRQTFDKAVHYTAEGALAWLNDGIVEPYDFPADFQDDPAYQAAATSGNVVAFFLGWLLDNYNAHAAPERQIKLGNVTVADPNNYITRADSNYPSTFEVVSKKLAGSSLGGYMVMRYEADGNYLDYLSGFVGNNAQEITFGENLLDLIRESSAAGLYTALLPLGAEGLTLSGLPDGPQENGLVKAGKILYNPEAEAVYGRIVRKAEYTDITRAENLLRTAIKDMGAEIHLPESLEVKASDLHYLDGKTPSFRLGLYTVVVSAPHGIVRRSYPLTELRPNLLDPGSTPITLNGTASQLTARLRQAQQAEQERMEREIQAVVKEASSWIDQLVKNASGLYCTPEAQTDGSTIYYLHDKPTLAESTNVIRLTADAIGFSTDGGNSYPYGFAITGEMVANLLYAHGVNAEWIRTGILQSTDGTTFFLDLDKGILNLDATSLTISGKSVNEAMSDAITGTEQQFYLSTSPTALAGGNWSNAQPEWTPGKYIWSRQYVTYGNGSHAYLPSESGVCITGNTGADGKDGTNGTSTYTHIRYSSNSNGSGFVEAPTTSTKYIGIYTGTSRTAPTSNTSYTWSKYMGDNGTNGTNGKDGNGIRSITYYYAATTSQTAPDASKVTSTTMPALSATNKYLWQKEVIDFTDPSVADKTTVILLAVHGENGTNGTSVSIRSTSITYQASNSGTATPTGNWGASIPPIENGQYLWTKTVVSYSDNTTTTSYSVAYKGTNGDDGIGVESVVAEYCTTKSASSSAGGTWSTAIPTVTDSEFIWYRQKITYTNGDVKYTGAYCMSKTVGDIAQQKVDAQTQMDIFNKLTNGGKREGLYMQDGKLYVNASYIAAGKIASKNGRVYFDLDNNQIVCNRLVSSTATGTSTPAQLSIDQGVYSNGDQYAMVRLSLAGQTSNHFRIYARANGRTYIYSVNGLYIGQENSNYSLQADGSHIGIYSSGNWVYVDEHDVSVMGTDKIILSAVNTISLGAKQISIDRTNIQAETSPYILGLNYDNKLIFVSSSSQRYKDIMRPMDKKDVEALFNISPVIAKYKDGYLSEKDERNGVYHPMFIAEDVEKYAPLAVDHNEKGRAENWNYRVMIPCMFQMIKDLKAEIDDLRAQVEKLRS